MKSRFPGSMWAMILVALAIPTGLTAQEHHPLRYKITDLGAVGFSQPIHIANSGLISGGTTAADGTEHATLWYKQRKADIGQPGLGGANSMAYSNNEWGQVVGQANTSTADPNGEDFCGFKSLGFAATGNSCLAFFWQDGRMKPLPTLGGSNGLANTINNRGEVAGEAENTTEDSTCPPYDSTLNQYQVLQGKPVAWIKGKVHELLTAGGDPDGTALGINDHGQIVGTSGTCSTFSPQLLIALQPLHALLWEPGKRTPIDLGSLGGTGHFSGNVALNINNKGQVVGNSDLPGDTANHAFLWTKEKGMRDLGTLPGDFISAGISINDSGEIVGTSIDANFNLRAYVWRNGEMTDLNTLVDDTQLYLILACYINSHGQIIGLGIDKNSGEAHGFLATPTYW